MAGRTQKRLYSQIDLGLSWSEDALPQAERTKLVHALHPYLGKFIPQLVEAFLARYFVAGDCIYDPFAGSGTTLVEANAFGCDAVGVDISAFNCLLADVKTARHSLPALEAALARALTEACFGRRCRERPSEWLESWFAPQALEDLLAYRAAAERLDRRASLVASVVLARAARSARLTTHFDLDFPRKPVRGPYLCYKHRRTCRPVEGAVKFLRRYTLDTLRRLSEFARYRRDRRVSVLHADARSVALPLAASGVVTSPPYPGLIDYHEQHRYAYELLALEDRRADEIGSGSRGRSRGALAEYVDGMVDAFANARRQVPGGAPVGIVVNDSQNLYPEILRRAGLSLEERSTRHVNRRTGRRAGEFFEDVLVCRTS